MLVLVLALVLVNAVTFAVVLENQRSGVYPINGDSIGIPIIGTLVVSGVVLPMLVLIGFLPGAQFVKRLCSRGLPWRIGAGLLLLAVYVAVGFFALGAVEYWAIPNHYWIATSYVLSFLALAFFSILDARWLLSNRAAHPDAREASHVFSPSQSRAGGRER
jgi:hypothetical protein